MPWTAVDGDLRYVDYKYGWDAVWALGPPDAPQKASWLVFDFGRDVSLDGIRLYSHGDGIHDVVSHYFQAAMPGTYPANAATGTAISNGAKWGAVVGQFTGSIGSAAPQDFHFDAKATARVWRWGVPGVVPTNM
jgi:hypothetical protein